MTDVKEYYVAELMDDSEAELSQEDKENIAELQQIHRSFELEDVFAEKSVAQLSEEEKTEYELVCSTFIQRGKNLTDDEMAELYDYFGVDEERLAELSED